MKDLREELNELIVETGIIQRVYCSKEETKQFKKLQKDKQPLPEGVIFTDIPDVFFRYEHTDLSDKELSDLFLYRQTKYLYSIRNMMIFLVVLVIIGLVGAFMISSRF